MRARYLLVILCLSTCCAIMAEPSTDDRALGLRVRAQLQQVVQSPGREAAHRVLQSPLLDWVAMLLGEKPASDAQLQQVRTQATQYASALQGLIDWPRAATVTIPHARTAPIIDGVLNEKVWARAATFSTLYPINQPNAAAGPATTWRLLWDARYLYVGVTCTDTTLLAPVFPRDGEVYSHDCVEVFVLPDLEKPTYWEIEVGATGSIYDGQHTKRQHQWGSEYHPEATLPGLQTAVRCTGTPNQPGDVDTGYTVEIAIPAAGLPGFPPGQQFTRRTQLHLLLTRFDRFAEGKDGLATYAFCPLNMWTHNIWSYAPVRLGR